MSMYEKDLFLNGMKKTCGVMFLPKKAESESTGVDIVSLLFRDDRGNILESPVTGEPAVFCVEYKSSQEIENAGLNFGIQELAGERDHILRLSSFEDDKLLKILPGKHGIQVWMTYLGLKPGLYTMKVVLRKDSLYVLDAVETFRFTVKGKGSMARSLFYQPRSWKSVARN